MFFKRTLKKPLPQLGLRLKREQLLLTKKGEWLSLTKEQQHVTAPKSPNQTTQTPPLLQKSGKKDSFKDEKKS